MATTEALRLYNAPNLVDMLANETDFSIVLEMDALSVEYPSFEVVPANPRGAALPGIDGYLASVLSSTRLASFAIIPYVLDCLQ